MSEQEEQVQAAPEHTEVPLAYAGASRMVPNDDGSAALALFGNLKRDPVQFDAEIKDPLRLREALSALYSIVGSDFRYVPKDRTAYQAYQRLRKQSANLNAWEAQQAYFSWLQRHDPMAWLILDPVISVHPDEVAFEVFSKDEGTYAKLSVKHDAFDISGKPVCGTTNIDFSDALFKSILQMRGYRKTRLQLGQEAVTVNTEGDRGGEVLEKQIRIPDSWLRGFLQVQSASMLPCETFSLSPLDLYNVLRHLRMHADEKGKRRGLRIELVPGEVPVLVLEPWETVIQAHSEPYQGTQAQVIRIWGRRRLRLLKQILPLIDSIDVHVSGSGLPSFWVLRGAEFTLTLGLTGFTASNWSQAASFDLLLPRQTTESADLEKVVKHLSKTWSDDLESISKATKLKGEKLMDALQLGCGQGQLMCDLAANVYRLRPLTNVPLDLNRLEYRNVRERLAHDLLARKGAIAITQENRIHGTGMELTGKVTVAEDERSYQPQFLISEDGHVGRAECTCTFHRKQGLKHGPCAHLIGLRLAHAQREQRRASGQGRQTVTVETRIYSRRSKQGETVYQLSLDRQGLKVRWGQAGQALRLQQWRFDSVDDARMEYFKRIEELQQRGFLDASSN